MEQEKVFHQIMKELCGEMNIKLEKLSYNWILQLSKNGKVRHITGNRFDINPEATGNIACDKYATFEVLKSQNIPVIKHAMAFNPSKRSKYVTESDIIKIAENEFKKYKCLVVKPNDGSEGKGVTLCKTMEDTKKAIKELFQENSSISVCPYYDIKKEYRTFYLNGEVMLIYGKTKPFVIGDGKNTTGKLIEKLKLPNKRVVRENLNLIDLNKIPEENEKVEISWKHNLSGGAKPNILEKGELYSQIEELAIRAGKAMNINFATIDIIETTDNNLQVLEINSGVSATLFIELVDEGYELIKSIYRKCLIEMFEL